jgi:hypothetical protein
MSALRLALYILKNKKKKTNSTKYPSFISIWSQISKFLSQFVLSKTRGSYKFQTINSKFFFYFFFYFFFSLYVFPAHLVATIQKVGRPSPPFIYTSWLHYFFFLYYALELYNQQASRHTVCRLYVTLSCFHGYFTNLFYYNAIVITIKIVNGEGMGEGVYALELYSPPPPFLLNNIIIIK